MKWIDGFLSYLKNEKNYADHTLVAYRTDLCQFDQYLTIHLDISDWSLVRHAHVRSWIVFLMKDNYSARSINRKISSLKSCYKYARKKGLTQQNPMSLVVLPKIGKRLPSYVRQEAMEQVPAERLEDLSFSFIRDRLIVEILYSTGIRRFELIELREQDIHSQRLEIRILGKGSKQRIVPITDGLLRMIENYNQLKSETFESSSSFLIVTDKGRKAYPKFIYNKVHTWLNGITTIEKRSPHVLRHTFATHMANNGADLNAIKEILGHSSLAATQVYTHNTVDQLKRVYDKAHPKAR